MLIINSHGINTSVGASQVKEAIASANINTENCSVLCVTHPKDERESSIRDNAINILGFKSENIFFTSYETLNNDFSPDIIYIGEGNTYELLEYMQEYGIVDFIRKHTNAVFIGSSAGALILGTDINLAKFFDSCDHYVWNKSGLGLFDGAFFPHCSAEKFEMFMKNADPIYIDGYTEIIPVGDDEWKIIE